MPRSRISIRSWTWRWNAWFETSCVRAVRIIAETRMTRLLPISESIRLSASALGSRRGSMSLMVVEPREHVFARLAHRGAPRAGAALQHLARERRADAGDAARHRLTVRLLGAREPVALVELG